MNIEPAAAKASALVKTMAHRMAGRRPTSNVEFRTFKDIRKSVDQ